MLLLYTWKVIQTHNKNKILWVCIITNIFIAFVVVTYPLTYRKRFTSN